MLCCESLIEERSAGNSHATFCGNRRRVTAFGDPVTEATASSDPISENAGFTKLRRVIT
jgi:hypothetical protein